MTAENFQNQMNRLKDVFGDKYYPVERCAVIFRRIRHVGEDIFEKAIELLLASKRSPPMLPEIIGAIEETSVIEKKKMSYGSINPEEPGLADPDFVDMCNNLFQDFSRGKITKDQFVTQCSQLERLAEQITKAKKQ